MTTDMSYSAILPEIIMFGGAVLVLLADLLRRPSGDEEAHANSSVLSFLSVVVVAAAAAATFAVAQGEDTLHFQTSAVADTLTFGIRLVVLATAALVLLIGPRYVPSFTRQAGEYYTLLLLCAGGMTAMAAAADLMTLFLALETFSLSLILLAGMFRENPHSTEASMKYFLLSAFASAFFVFGGALLYGATGTINFMEMAALAGSGGAAYPALLWVGTPLLLVGFGFKLSVAPFHMWTPDVYQGAPTTVTAFMSVGTKTAMFGALIRLFLLALPDVWAESVGPLAILAVLTMTVGNITALSQTSLKRMLGYSSIAHAGYVLAGLLPGTPDAISSALFYLFAYAFMNVGAFVIIVAIEQTHETDIERSQLRQAGRSMPLLAGFMALFLFSLSGVPPLAGFFGKFLLFRSIIDAGFHWLAVAMVLNSAVSAYYYLRVVLTMYFRSASSALPPQQRPIWNTLVATEVPRPITEPPVALSNRGLQFGMAAAGVMVVVMGVFPSFWLGLLAF